MEIAHRRPLSRPGISVSNCLATSRKTVQSMTLMRLFSSRSPAAPKLPLFFDAVLQEAET
jgi:hypothetical protein